MRVWNLRSMAWVILAVFIVAHSFVAAGDEDECGVTIKKSTVENIDGDQFVITLTIATSNCSDYTGEAIVTVEWDNEDTKNISVDLASRYVNDGVLRTTKGAMGGPVKRVVSVGVASCACSE